jgi:hypothetical protein
MRIYRYYNNIHVDCVTDKYLHGLDPVKADVIKNKLLKSGTWHSKEIMYSVRNIANSNNNFRKE